MLLNALKDVSDLLFPYFCLVCGKSLRRLQLCTKCTPPTPNNELRDRCAVCFSTTPDLDSSGSCYLCRLIPPIISNTRFLWEYELEAANLISCIKYRPSYALAKVTATKAQVHFDTLFPYPQWDAIVPVPSSTQSMSVRPFNFAEVLADGVAKHLAASIKISVERLLKHRGYKSVQASLKGEARLNNVRNAFVVSRSKAGGKNILLVDDVITTGATTTVAAATLLEAGADRVDLFGLARAPNWCEFRQKIAQMY